MRQPIVFIINITFYIELKKVARTFNNFNNDICIYNTKARGATMYVCIFIISVKSFETQTTVINKATKFIENHCFSLPITAGWLWAKVEKPKHLPT